MHAITALHVLRDRVIRPLLAGGHAMQPAPHPTTTPTLDQHYERLRRDLQPLFQVFQEIGIAA
jgi:hypothetical protein